eukprot:scaffold11429_cov48-Cyclotella_meneghiniana.AAC.7
MTGLCPQLSLLHHHAATPALRHSTFFITMTAIKSNNQTENCTAADADAGAAAGAGLCLHWATLFGSSECRPTGNNKTKAVNMVDCCIFHAIAA